MKVQDLRSTYQLRIELQGIQPPIWRRLLMRNSTSLADLHVYLQIAMGWENSHLHQFLCQDVAYGLSEETKSETDFRISQLLKNIGESLSYEYDFGDGWQHEVKLERITTFDTEQVLPFCVGGRRACPPEDIGGIPVYETCLSALASPEDPANEEMLKFVTENFDPEYFNIDDVNEGLRQYQKDKQL